MSLLDGELQRCWGGAPHPYNKPPGADELAQKVAKRDTPRRGSARSPG